MKPDKHNLDRDRQIARQERWRNFHRQVRDKSNRKLKVQGERNTFLGLITYGLVGWAVAIPILIGISIGLWLDREYPSDYSWTLICLLVGAVLGCFNAWYWIQKVQSDRDGL